MTQDAREARFSRPARCGATALAALAALAVIGCATLGNPGQSLVPDRVETRTGPFAVYTNTKIAADAPMLRELLALENDLASRLGLRVAADGPPVEVYILKDRDAFTHFLRFYHPELPPRRAFFLAQGQKRMVYTYVNDRLDEDLRHEATHALLHAAVGDLPLWLDEGLAEYFEGPEGRAGVNPEHLARLPGDVKAGWLPDLARLETLTDVREMSPRDYRESWAWVHYLLNGPPAGKAAVFGYLADLRTDPPHAAPLSERVKSIEPASAKQLLTHIERVRVSPVPTTTPAPVAATPANSRPTVLLQNSPIDPGLTRTPRRSWLSRFLAVFGSSSRAASDGKPAAPGYD